MRFINYKLCPKGQGWYNSLPGPKLPPMHHTFLGKDLLQTLLQDLLQTELGGKP